MRTALRIFPLITLLSVGCTAKPSQTLNRGGKVNYTRCVLLADQGRGSLLGQWASLPVGLVLDKDFYVTDGGEALPALRSAIQSWNTWAGFRSKTAFVISNDGSGYTAGSDIPDQLNSCAQASYSSAVTGVVGIWKINGTGLRRNQRDACGVDDEGATQRILPYGVQGQTDWITQNGRILGASILLNFELYNAPGKQRVDVESLLLHELGHVLGLLHSCNGSSSDSTDSTTAPNCNVAPSQYTNAVMYPFLIANQERRKLQQNDYNRINCLY